MSRLLLGLCSFILTVGLIALVGEDVGASNAPGTVRRAIVGPSYTHSHGSWKVIQVAKKKPKTKKSMKKEEASEPAEKPAEATPAPAAGDDTSGLKFSKDIAPIFANNCTRCHKEGGEGTKKSKLDLTTFERIMKGAAKHEVIVAGDPESSELVLRIKGESQGRKMPPGNRENLGENAIAKIEQWIKTGAILDKGIDPKAQLASYAASPEQLRREALSKLPTDELEAQLKKSGLDRWKKASAKVEPDFAHSPGKHFIMFSSLPKGRAEDALKKLDPLVAKLKALVGPGAIDPVDKPTFFVFNDRTTFTVFVKDVQSREADEEERGTADFAVEHPYVAVIDPLGGQEDPGAKHAAHAKKDDEGPSASRSLAGIIAEQLTIGVVAHAGKPPRWLSMGLGAYIEAQLEGPSPYISRLRTEAYRLCQQGWQSKAVDALGEQTKSEEVQSIGYALVDWLATTGYLAPFVKGMMQGGDKLDDVISSVLNGKRDDFLAASGDYIMNTYGGRRR